MNNRLTSTLPLNTDAAALLLRIMFGGMFVHYGYEKFTAYDTILPMFTDIIGIGAKLSFNLVIFAELFCGFFVLIGLLTRITVIPIFVTMVVAFFVAHAKDPLDTKALPLVFMILSIIIFILGSGKISIDALIIKNKRVITN